MQDSTASEQSYISLYSRIWLGCTTILIFLRFVGLPQEQRGYILIGYMGFSWLLLIGINIFEGQRLARYITLYRPELIKRGHYGFGTSGLQGWRLFGFSEGIKKSNDARALWFLENYKDVVMLQILAFISYPILFIITVM